MPDVEQQPDLTYAGARRVLDAALDAARQLGVDVVVAVVDRGGNPLALARMDAAPLFSVTVAEKKAWTAIAARTRTADLAGPFTDDPVLLHALAPKVDDLMAVGGGAPVVVHGRVAGAVAVSGATEAQDQEIADAGAAAVGGTEGP